jgi:hypothetical protein
LKPENNLKVEQSSSGILKCRSDKCFSYKLASELLKELIKELVGILNSDILPRWKKRSHFVESFLSNEPFPVGAEESKKGSSSRLLMVKSRYVGSTHD